MPGASTQLVVSRLPFKVDLAGHRIDGDGAVGDDADAAVLHVRGVS